MQERRSSRVELYRGMGMTDEGAERILTVGICPPASFYFRELWRDVFWKYFGVDASTASLKEIILASHRDSDVIEKFTSNYPNASWFPRASFSETPEEAVRFARKTGSYVVRAVVPRRLLAPSIEAAEPRHIAAPYVDEYEKRTEREWVSVPELFPAKYVAGVLRLRDGAYIPNKNHLANKGYDPRDFRMRCGAPAF